MKKLGEKKAKQSSVLNDNIVADIIINNFESKEEEEKHMSVFSEDMGSQDFDNDVYARRRLCDFISYRRNKYDGILSDDEMRNNMNVLLKHANAVYKFLGPYVDDVVKKELVYTVCGEHWESIEHFDRDYRFLMEKKLIKLPLHYQAVVGIEQVGKFIIKVLPFLKYLKVANVIK